MAAKQSLGRGIGALLPTDFDKSILEEDINRVQKIQIDAIEPNPGQPRREFDPQSLAELTASIKTHGVLQPIIVVRAGEGYQIVAGERRWRATRAAGLTTIPAIVRSLAELEKVEMSLIENVQRVDLSPLEQAVSLYKLQHQFNLNLDQIAAKLGKAPSTISNIIRLLQLPDAARQALIDNQISEGHARAILALKHRPQLQSQLLDNILAGHWTVRQAEKFVIDTKAGDSPTNADPEQLALAKSLSSNVGAPVSIKRGRRGGVVSIKFKTDEQYQKIIQTLGN